MFWLGESMKPLGGDSTSAGPYHQRMEMKTFLQSRWGASTLSAVVSIVCGIAIVALGAPPAILILALWATISIYLSLTWPGKTPRRR
jgi:hypothetical protein